MENREFPVGNGNEKIKLTEFGMSALADFLVFLLSAVTAHISDLQFFSPLGIAFCGGVPRKYTLFSCLGGMLGYMISSDSVTSFRYVMTLLLVYILKAYVSSFPKLKDKVLPYTIVSLFSTVSTGIIVTVTMPFDTKILFLRLAEFLIASGGTYIFTVGFKSAEKIKDNLHLTNRELIFTTVSFLIIIMSFSKITVFDISFSGIICSYFVMCASYIYREKGGSVIGTGVSMGFVMTGRADPFVFCYSAAGLFSGIFSYSGRVLSAMAYVFSYGGIYLFFGGNKENYFAPLIETALASVFFVLTPQKSFYKAKGKLLTKEKNDNDTLKMILTKTNMIKEGILGLNRTLDFVSDKLKLCETPQTAGIYLRVRDKVCSDCASYDKCWKQELFKTIGEFDAITDEMRKQQKITPSGAPMSLQSRCIRIMSLCESFNKNYDSYCASLGAEGKVNEMRKVTKDQFVTITNLLDDMFSDFEEGIRPLGEKSESYRECLNEIGVDCDVICYEDENMNQLLNITVISENNVSCDEIKEALENVDEIEFENPTVIEGGESKVMLFWEKPYFKVECNYFQIPQKDGDNCGDCFDSFYDGRGNFVAVLSDGMGTGSRAAIDGNMTAGLFSKLIIWGFSFPCALRLVNSAMMLKSSEESMATLDILKINLYTGETAMYKAGATVSLMKRGGKVSIIKKAAMPVGILRQTEFATVRGTLKNNDEIVIMSDGATDNGLNELENCMREQNYKIDSAEKLCGIAKSICKGKCDDITVGVVRLLKNTDDDMIYKNREKE